jgi:hypothetical protein
MFNCGTISLRGKKPNARLESMSVKCAMRSMRSHGSSPHMSGFILYFIRLRTSKYQKTRAQCVSRGRRVPSPRRTTCPLVRIASCRGGQTWRGRGGSCPGSRRRPSGHTSCLGGCSESTPCRGPRGSFVFQELGGSKTSDNIRAFLASISPRDLPYDVMLVDRIIKLVKLDPRTRAHAHLFDTLHGRVECRKGPDEDVVTLPADREELIDGRH